MKRMSLVAAGMLAACATAGPRPEAYTSQGWSLADSFLCARRAVTDLGYQPVAVDATREFLRAARDFDRDQQDGGEYTRGYLTVSVDRGDAREVLRVSAERYVEGTRRVGDVMPRPDLIPPRGRPEPYDTTDVLGRRRPRRGGPRRVNPGPTATHARQVVRQCSHGEMALRD